MASTTSSSSLEIKVDGFDRLKSIREKERLEKYKQKLLARSVSAQQNLGAELYTDNDMLLQELTKESQKGDLLDSTSKEETDIDNNLKRT